MNRVNDKVALISGGGSGIGKTFCGILAKAGTQVVICDAAEQTFNNILADNPSLQSFMVSQFRSMNRQ